MSDRFEQGMKTRREVLGDAHVDRAEAAKSELDLPFQTLITEGAWGTVWSSTARTGASKADVMEAFQHVAIYAGVPKANHAIKLAKATYAEMETSDE